MRNRRTVLEGLTGGGELGPPSAPLTYAPDATIATSFVRWGKQTPADLHGVHSASRHETNYGVPLQAWGLTAVCEAQNPMSRIAATAPTALHTPPSVRGY
ncbi:hypothetical protein Cob_v003805 [Colletotrichum orbiculare MAFF 240422]|uniref:Uncharacterized protein n=1 Tax=Colletotrichum orbiculare (strain 104-T / ATCC 96160 / CBS 514.97 / LARS 414 / MAFF 240422) TaxID=1213857 RepID=A0A484FYP7_COLOR|nr:hypothetical protein Cob_v003805 [Colletotrichum orbiculare MAFF 240422]